MTTATSASALVHRRDRSALARTGVRGEWLLTNGLGGFAMGSWCGIPERRYHAHLVAAERPPVDRAALLSGFGEDLVFSNGERAHLATLHFSDRPSREERNAYLDAFETGPGYAEWTYTGRTGGVDWRLVKTLTLAHGRNAAHVRYRVEAPGGVGLELRPLLALRDFHQLNNRAAEAAREVIGVRALGEDGVVVASAGHGLQLVGKGAAFTEEPAWWRGIECLLEFERGQDCVEDLFCPGVFTTSAPETLDVSITASMDADAPMDAEAERAAAMERAIELGDAAKSGLEASSISERDAGALERLGAATDAFVVRRGSDGGVSVIAGYPWFADWGRDTMICLPGLFLEMGRFDEARRVLEVFGEHRCDGVIPNRFDDYGGEPHYNTVDASLWYLHAACLWLQATGDRAAFDGVIGDACLDITKHYRKGTMHGIGVDPADGLVRAGDETTQLTWMDAQRDGVTFTPRHGKAVEINALWIHGLRSLAHALGGGEAETLRAWADEASASFAAQFWNADDGCWFDTLRGEGEGEWTPIAEIRPNQVFAMSLAHGPVHGETGAARELAIERSRRALGVIERTLVTPEGLRTLAPEDPSYRGRFWGSLMERDAAYHQGTVWPWLMGAYVEAVVRVSGDRGVARRALDGLIAQLDGWYPGTIAEVFDGDAQAGPRGRSRWPAGCIAQAWSVGETLRALRLVLR